MKKDFISTNISLFIFEALKLIPDVLLAIYLFHSILLIALTEELNGLFFFWICV